MHLYSRTGLFIGPFAELMGWAADITKHVSDVIGSEVALWSAGFGAPVGTLGWSLPVDGVAEVAANNEKMIGDAKYHEMVAAGREYSQPGSVEDSLMALAHGELTDDRPPIGAVATITTATMDAPYADVIGWGIDVAQMVEDISGVGVLFGTSVYGSFTDVGWIGVSGSAAASDAANQKLSEHADYIKKLSEASEMFVSGSGHRTFMTRVA